MEEIYLGYGEPNALSFGDPFSIVQMAKSLYEENCGILVLLDFIKAKDWPFKRRRLHNDPLIEFPLLWGTLTAPDEEHLRVLYDIHPCKCLPRLFNEYNPNGKTHPMPLVTLRKGTLSGCSRNYVTIQNRKYKVNEKTPDYCAVFGAPDDCFDPSFEARMLRALEAYKDLTLWCFEESDYIRNKISPHASLRFMKGGFLPSRHFIHSETSEDFLKGVYRARQLETLNQELWYLHGKEFIEEMNLNDLDHCIRFEEEAIKIIEKRLAFECLRQSLLLMKRSDFASYVSKGPPALVETREQEARLKLGNVIRSLERDTEFHLNSLLGNIKATLDNVSFNSTRFLVMDVEHVHVSYPTENQGRAFNFPCIFTHIIWRGQREGISTKVNAFALPCHACDEDCKHFKRNTFRYDCLSYGYDFFDKESSMIESLLTRYEGFKLYSYGKSDIFQLEQCANFFLDAFQMKKFRRRNRKRMKRLIDVSEDLEVPGESLRDVEEETIKKWLIGWARIRDHLEVNRRFMIRSDSPRWKDSYLEALESSISDTVSAFLYLIYSKFLLVKNSIGLPKQLTILDIA